MAKHFGEKPRFQDPIPGVLTTVVFEKLRKAVFRSEGIWAGLVFGPLLLVLVILFFIWWVTLTRIGHEHYLEIQNAKSDTLDISAVVAANLDQILGKTAIYGDLAAAVINGQPGVSSHINPTLNGDHAYLRIAVFDRSGGLLYSSARRQTEPVLAAFAKAMTMGFQVTPAHNSLAVGRPQVGTDPWRIPVLLGIESSEHKVGYLTAVLDLGYFLQLFRQVDLGRSGRIEILCDDGYQLVESNGAVLSSGQDFKNSEYLRFLQKAPAGSGEITRSVDQASSIVGYRHLEKYPFIVVVSRSSEEVLAAFRQRKENYVGWAAFVSLVVVAFALSLVSLANRQREIYQALAGTEEKNRKLILQLEEEKKRAYQLASHDHLTGLPNRVLFAELSASHILRARRSKGYHAVLFIDLDGFKPVNDTLGHKVGDLLLNLLAQRFRASLRESDVVARFGGDEFVVLINDAESIEGVAKIAEKIVTVVSEPFNDLEGHHVEVGASIGIAVYPQDGEDIDALLKNADAAMYVAKAAGRCTYRFHDMALNRQALRQMELLNGLRRAVREGEFVLHYQPQVRTSDFSLCGLEALVRWEHPELGLIFPSDFVPLAEDNDLISRLGHWVINAAMAQLADWRRREIPLVPIAINISAKQFRGDELVPQFVEAMRQYDLPGHLLEIEVTESCLLEEPDRAIRILSELTAMGISISLDDYGTGFSSLGYLKKLPLHTIKIDRAFIREIHNDSSDEVIVDSTTTLAHNLHLLVVAEGVETRDQLVHLKTIGCDRLQGYYFQRPVPAVELEPLLYKGSFLK